MSFFHFEFRLRSCLKCGIIYFNFVSLPDYTELRPDAYLIGLKRKKMCLVYNTSRLNTEHRIKCITQNKFICEIPAGK